jgi:uncharacterized protein (TIGR02145 family)
MKKINVLSVYIVFLLSFSFSGYSQVKDIDGNNYKTVTVGSQVWMAENLKTTKYNDGALIPGIIDNVAWGVLTTPGCSWYNNDATGNKNKYGALYNWYTVSTNKLCSKGWHVPSDTEWSALTTNLGGESTAGGKLKETGTTHWEKPNSGVTNESSFTALPGGYRNNKGAFANIGFFGFWWSSTEYVATAAWCRSLSCGGNNVLRIFSLKKNGYSVRCIKDN